MRPSSRPAASLGDEILGGVVVDLGSLRSVAGADWARDMIQRCRRCNAASMPLGSPGRGPSPQSCGSLSSLSCGMQDEGGRPIVVRLPPESLVNGIPEFATRLKVHEAVVEMFNNTTSAIRSRYLRKIAFQCNSAGLSILQMGDRCNHEADQHEPLSGCTRTNGRSTSRTADRWTPVVDQALPGLSEGRVEGEAGPPQACIRRRGTTDCLTQSAPQKDQGRRGDSPIAGARARRRRAPGRRPKGIQVVVSMHVLPTRRLEDAKLHGNLGQLSYDWLALRKLVNVGASLDIIQGANGMRCMICVRLQAPQSNPQASHKAPGDLDDQRLFDTSSSRTPQASDACSLSIQHARRRPRLPNPEQQQQLGGGSQRGLLERFRTAEGCASRRRPGVPWPTRRPRMLHHGRWGRRRAPLQLVQWRPHGAARRCREADARALIA